MKKVRILSALGSLGASVLLAASPAFALEVSVSGNGADSTNNIAVSASQTTSILQTNTADITNNVNADANTGNNSANDNTGGDTSINTGNAATAVNLNNSANSNTLDIGCCEAISTSVKIAGNGSGSTNYVDLRFSNNRYVLVQNRLNIYNDIYANANTGGNEANGNTGGNTTINTGNANVSVNVSNSGNVNQTSVCSCLLPGLVKPPTVTPPAIPGLTPGVPAVLGVSKTLPMTGFDYPYQVIFAVTLTLLGLGLVLRNKTSEIEQALTSLAAKLNLV